MKKTITMMAFAVGLFNANAQTTVESFESFTLSPNSAYSPTPGVAFQASNALFDYKSSGGYWSDGFAYTNVYDSITAGYANTYGVRAYKGYNSSSVFVVGQNNGKITLSAPQTTVSGFYITNTTYAYKSMVTGDQFAKKFGGTTGNDPDYFKVVVKGYKNGGLKNDSVTAMLADFTFSSNTQDYILNSWQFVNTASIGEVDSLKFIMRSSDVGQFGINTPTYFAIDNFTTLNQTATGIAQHPNSTELLSAYPNPFSRVLNLQLTGQTETSLITLSDLAGKLVYSASVSEKEIGLNLNALPNGVYFLQVRSNTQLRTLKVVKN